MNALRQSRFQLIQFLADAFDYLFRVSAGQAQHQPLHGFSAAALRDHAVPGNRADFHLSQIAQPDRRTVLHLDHDRSQIVQAGNAAFAANEQHFVAFAEPARTVVAVVRFDRLFQLRHRHTAHGHPDLIGNDFVRANDPSQSIDVGDTRNRPQRGADDPVEQTPSFRQGQPFAFDDEHIHFPERRRDGCHAARNTGRQAFGEAAQALAHLLARPIDIGAVLEVDGHIDQAVLDHGAQDAGLGDTEHLDLDRHRDPAFDFLRRHAGSFHDDLDLSTRHVGEGVDRQPCVGIPARACEEQRRKQDEQTLRQRKLHETGEHHLLPFWSSHAPLSATTPL